MLFFRQVFMRIPPYGLRETVFNDLYGFTCFISITSSFDYRHTRVMRLQICMLCAYRDRSLPSPPLSAGLTQPIVRMLSLGPAKRHTEYSVLAVGKQLSTSSDQNPHGTPAYETEGSDHMPAVHS